MRKTENHILSVLSWFHSVLLFAGFYLVIPSLMDDFSQGIWKNLLKSAVLFIPVIASYIMMRKMRNIVIYLILAIAITGSIYVVTGNVLTLIFSAMIFLIRCQARIEKGRLKKQMRDFPGEDGRFIDPEAWEIPTILDKPKIFHCILFLLEYFLLIYSGYHKYLSGIFYLLFLEIIIIFISYYINHMKEYIQSHQKIANLPGKMILRNGYVIFAGMMLLFLSFILPSILYGEEPLTSLYHKPDPQANVNITFDLPEQEEDPMLQMMGEIEMVSWNPPKWLKVVDKVVVWVTQLLLTLVIIRFLLGEIMRVFGSFAEEEDDEVIDLKNVKDEQKKIAREKKRIERSEKHTPDMRIRKKYRKLILKSVKMRPHGTETPIELEEKAGIIGDSRQPLIHRLYEKARYSAISCTEEEEKSL